MPDKAKTLLFSVLLLPATAMATTGNAEQQNTQQIRIEQIQEETALYEAMMPLIFTFMLGHFASGLVIYWTLSNLLSIIQQKAIMKKNGVN